MRGRDILALAVQALWQQKVRTALTALGVVVGSFVLAFGLALGQGVKRAVVAQLARHDELREIVVSPGYQPVEEDIPPAELEVRGAMSEARRRRLRAATVRRWRGPRKPAADRALTPGRVAELREWPHVEAVTPVLQWQGRVTFAGRQREALTVAVRHDNRRYRRRLVAGRFLEPGETRGLLVSEHLLYSCGVADEVAVEAALGRPLRVQWGGHQPAPTTLLYLLNVSRAQLSPEESEALAKAIERLPAALALVDLPAEEKKVLERLLRLLPPPAERAKPVVEELPVVGVFRDATREEDGGFFSYGYYHPSPDVLVPAETAEGWHLRASANRDAEFYAVTVRVDSEDHVQAVNDRLRGEGYNTFSLVEVLEQVRLNVLLVSLTAGVVALVALLVSGLGIANTLLMSVLERTHEIGVMKAVGARDRHVLLLFLAEGALVGAAGGLLGLALSWLASFPADRAARTLAEKQMHEPVDVALFAFPWWVVVGVPLFVTLLTMLAAVYPARRAARVDPVEALRHE